MKNAADAFLLKHARLGRDFHRVLLLPPDLTRAHSGAGRVTEMFYTLLPNAHVEVIPTLGQHQPHTEEENRRMLGIADGGELLVLGPGIERFGEQPEIDALIRKYGYRGAKRTLELYQTEADMQKVANGVAHLIHGSSEGRFTIRYAPGHLSREEVEQVGYEYADPTEMMKRYDPQLLKEGWNTLPDGEEIFYINTPSAGLWTTTAKLNDPRRRDLSDYVFPQIP